MTDEHTSTETTGAPPTGAGRMSGRARLRSALIPRATWRQVIVGVLCTALGFAAVTQVQARQSGSTLQTARQSDLVSILDSQTQLADQLETELAELRATLQDFVTNTDTAETALQQAQARAAVLGVLAGTLPATGPGVSVYVDAGTGPVAASVLLGAIQELRNAGAEVIQVNKVRIVADSFFTDGSDAVEINGTPVPAPYLIQAIGDADKLDTAMHIPGGVVDSFQRSGFAASVTKRTQVNIDALRPAELPRYASPTVAR